MAKSAEIKYKLQQAEKTKILALPNLNLFKLPEGVLALPLVRLDLSRNSLNSLPPGIGRLVLLQQLWVNDNPLTDLPEELCTCIQLRVVDASNTLIRAIRRDLSLLTHLVELNLDGCPLKPSLAEVYRGGMVAVVTHLRRKYDRKMYKNQLFQKLRETMYPEADPVAVMNTTCQVFDALKDVDSVALKLFLHNTTRVFPEKLAFVDTATIRGKLDGIQEEMSRKAEMSKLKLKLKARYPTESAEQIHALSDMLTLSFTPQEVQTIFKEKLLAKELATVNEPLLRGALDRFSQTVSEELTILENKLANKLQNVYAGVMKWEQAQVLAGQVTSEVRSPRLVRHLIMKTVKYLPEDRTVLPDAAEMVAKLQTLGQTLAS
jgi:hypothetical protein